MTYQSETEANAQAARAAVLTLVSALAAAEVSRGEFAALSAATILRANARAVVLADLGLAALLSALRRVPVPHLGMTLPQTERERVAKAVETTLSGEGQDYPVRFGRLANAEPLETGRRAFHEGMRERGVEGWTRRARPDACALCRSLADGSVIPIRKSMVDHRGCGCVAVPVLGEPADLPERSNRELSTGYGIARRTYTQPIPGLRFSRSRPLRGRVR